MPTGWPRPSAVRTEARWLGHNRDNAPPPVGATVGDYRSGALNRRVDLRVGVVERRKAVPEHVGRPEVTDGVLFVDEGLADRAGIGVA